MYDRDLLSASSTGDSRLQLPTIPVPTPHTLQDPPDSLADEKRLESWQTLLKDRRAWAIKVSETCERMVKEARKYDAETSVIQRATAIAVENIKQHVGTLHQKNDEANSWASDALIDQNSLLENWEITLKCLPSIPAKQELGRFFRPSSTVTARSNASPRRPGRVTLQDFVDVPELKKAVEVAKSVSQRLEDRIKDLKTAFDVIVRDSSTLIEKFNQAFPSPVEDVQELANRLIEEIEVLAKKVGSDYESSLGLPTTSKSLSTISKTALLHTRNLLPSLLETSSEIDQLLRHTVERKNEVIRSAISYMQKISSIESVLASVHPQLASLDIGTEGSEAFDTISIFTNIPLVYGSLLVETVRRREWREKMTADSSTLAEEMATFREDEERRRRKWLKTVGDYIDLEAVDSKALGIEVNIQAQEREWPQINRADITSFLDTLKRLGGFEEAQKEISEWKKALDAPSRQQMRRAKAFKNGSVHDATYGRNSLLLRGEDDLIRSLQSDNTKLEDRLKGSESRVRKLEDLLHRQSQIQKPPNANGFGPYNGQVLERHATSPLLSHAASSPKAQDSLSRRSSVSSRRFSANQAPEEKTLAQRLVKLEADLNHERAHVADLQGVAAERATVEHELRGQMQEAVSTKKDLFDNLEAQQREFDDERRLLEDEAKKLKLRLEEVEDELDRVLGSRDQEKICADDRVRMLEAEVEKVRKDSAEEIQEAQGQLDFLRNDYTMQREKAIQLERRVAQKNDDNADLAVRVSELSTRLQNRDESQAEHQRALRAAHLQLATDDIAPDGYDNLVEAVEILAERSAGHLQELKQALDTVRTERAALEEHLKQQNDEVFGLKDRLGIEEMEVFSLREELAEQRARFDSLRLELEDERKELVNLRSKFAVGETGSEALKARIAEEENKFGEVSAKLAASRSQVQRLEEGLQQRKSKLEALQMQQDTVTLHLEARAGRADEISMRLFSQTDRLSRLLEHLGFIVTKQDNAMVIQRISRAASGSIMINDPSQLMNRSLSGPLPTKSSFTESASHDHLHWAKANDLETEAEKFDAYIREIRSFDMDAFGEAIIKRIKELEHTARKWQREAKAYRDKSHRAQSEAHEKIAFRSFKEGDLALFLPTRNQATRPWAAFNVGAPHYFLREQDSHKLRTRDWLLARISKVEERVVDLSKSINGLSPPSDRRSIGDTSDGGASFDDENPFELSDGLRWYLLDAAEEKPGAPTTPGLGKSTVASANVDAKGSIRMKKSSSGNAATKTLTKSLDSRRSSTNSKKGTVGVMANAATAVGTADAQTTPTTVLAHNDTQSQQDDEGRGTTQGQDAEEVRKDLLWGP